MEGGIDARGNGQTLEDKVRERDEQIEFIRAMTLEEKLLFLRLLKRARCRLAGEEPPPLPVKLRLRRAGHRTV